MNYKKLVEDLSKKFIILDKIIIYRGEVPLRIKCKHCGKIYNKKLCLYKNFECSNKQCQFEQKFKNNNFKHIDKEKLKYMKMTNYYQIKPINNSHGEAWIKNILTLMGIKFEQQKTFSGLKGDSKKLRYDFFIPSHRLLIEYQGEQHYKPIKHFGGKQKFTKQKLYDNKKEKFADLNNYRLLKIKSKSPRIMYNKILNALIS